MVTCAIIPVYNHSSTVADMVANLRRHGLAIVLVDDGSDAECAGVLAHVTASNAEVSLVTLPNNCGKGTAVIAGAREALTLGFTHFLQIDADGQHDTNAVPAALEKAQNHPEAMIIGIPVFDASIPRVRLYGRWLTHVLVWIQTWSRSIRDAMCGFRIYPLGRFVEITNQHQIGTRMDFDMDIAVHFVWSGTAVEHVPVGVHYPVDGVSHFKMWHDNARITLMHFKLLGGMLIRIPSLARQRLHTARKN